MVFRIDTVITQHFKVLFGDVNNESFDEVHSRDAFRNRKVIFVPGIVESHEVSVIVINTGSGNDRTAQISADVFDGNIGSAEIGFCSHIETFRMKSIHVVFNFAKGRSQSKGKLIQKDFAECIAEKSIVEMLDRTPRSDVTGTAFRDKGMDMRVPFQVTSEGMEDTDESGSKVFCFVHLEEHTEDNISDGMK